MEGIAKRATIQANMNINGMDKLKQLNNTMNRITQRNRSMKDSFANTSDQLSRFNDIASEFGDRYKRMMEQSTDSNQEFARTSKEMARQFLDSQESMQDAIQKTKREQSENADSTVNSNRRIARSHHNVGNELDSNSSKLDMLTSAGHGLMKAGLGITSTFAGVTAATKQGIEEATDLQDQYNKVRILAKNGGEQPQEARRNTGALQQQGEKLSTNYGIDQRQFSQGNEDLIRRGYTTSAALGAQPEYSKASIASGDDYNDVVKTGAGALEAFNQRTNNVKQMHDNTKGMLNQLTYGADLTASDYKDLGWAMQYVGSTAHQSNQSSSQTIADLGELSQQNITGSRAGTSLRRIIEGLSNPKQNTLKSIGMKSSDLQDSHGKLKSISNDMEAIDQHVQGMTQTQRYNVFKSLFGMQGEQAAQILSTNTKQVDNLNQNVKNAPNMNGGNGYNTAVAAQNMRSFKGQSRIALQNFKAMQTSIAGAMLPDLAKIVGWANKLFQKFNNLPKREKQTIGRRIGWTGLATGAFGSIALVAGTIASSIRSITRAMKSVRRLFSKKVPRAATNSMASQAVENNATSDIFNHSSNDSSSYSNATRDARGTEGVGRDISDVAKTGHLSRVEKNAGILSRINPLTRTRSTVSGAARDASEVSRLGKLGKLARFGGHITSILSIGSSLIDLLGMNKKNAGKKIGSAGGSMAGGAAGTGIGGILGTLIAPGAGTAVGGALGGGLGSTLGEKGGSILGKMIPQRDVDKITKNFQKIGSNFMKMTKPIRQQAHNVAKSFGDMVKSWNNSTFGQVINSSVIVELKGLGKFVTWFTKGSLHTIGGLLSWLWQNTKSTFDMLGGIFSGGFKTLRGLFETFAGLFSGNWSKMWKGMEDTFFGVTHIFGSITGSLEDVFNNTLGSIGNSVGKTFDWMVTKAEHAGEMILHPIKAFRGELNFQKQATKEQQDSITKSQRSNQGRVMSGSALNNQAPKDKDITQWAPLVKSNLRKLHLSTSRGMINKVLRQINTESTGNSNRIGGNDGQPQYGNASGLMQVKPATFNQYKNRNGQLMNPNDNIYAALNYGKSKYGNRLTGLGNIGKNGVGIGFGNGGWSSSPAVFGEVSGQPEVAINPAKSSADDLIQQAIQARAKYSHPKANKRTNNNTQSNISSMMGSSRGDSGKSVQITQNFNVDGNADVDHISQTTKRAVKQVINEFFNEKNDATFNS